jgi:hypothetical protein
MLHSAVPCASANIILQLLTKHLWARWGAAQVYPTVADAARAKNVLVGGEVVKDSPITDGNDATCLPWSDSKGEGGLRVDLQVRLCRAMQPKTTTVTGGGWGGVCARVCACVCAPIAWGGSARFAA